MAERSKAHAWKACIRLSRIEGSNPSLSATVAYNLWAFLYSISTVPKLLVRIEALSNSWDVMHFLLFYFLN